MRPRDIAHWLFAPDDRNYLWARWLFLRALGLIFFSAFYSFYFQVDGLIGPHGILPAQEFLAYLAGHLGAARYWYAPSLFWLSSSTAALKAACWAGMTASLLMTFNLWPQGMDLLCTALYLSFISTLQVFSSYQSDGMLLEAGFITFFFAPSGLRPGLGEKDPPSRTSRFLLLFLVFRIYFESGLAKMLSGDPHWRRFTAMDDYYSNGPLPTWIGYYAQQLPHWFHAGCTLLTLAVELALVWMFFLPRRIRIAGFWILCVFQIGIILTANYTFINYITIALTFLLLDDEHLEWLLRKCPLPAFGHPPPRWGREQSSLPLPSRERDGERGVRHTLWLWLSGFFLGWVFYANAALLMEMVLPALPLPLAPAGILEPFRFANRFGLFAVMTPARNEIEFQGTRDGKTWVPYPFRYKPQDPRDPPRIYAPYQPRFDWNLWFASLEPWRQNPWVVHVEELLLENEPSVLALFRSNPFADAPPRTVRTVYWQYWFTALAEKRRDGLWWRREERNIYAPTLERRPDGKIVATAMP